MNFLGFDLPGPPGLPGTKSDGKATIMVVRRNLCKRLEGRTDTWEYRSSISLIGTDPKHDSKVAEAMGRYHYQYVDFRNFNDSLFFEDIQTAVQGCVATPEPMMDGAVELLNIATDLGYELKTCVVIQNADGSTTTVWTAVKSAKMGLPLR